MADIEYEIGKHLGLDKNGKLELQSSKEKLIKLAKNKILEWEKFIKMLNK